MAGDVSSSDVPAPDAIAQPDANEDAAIADLGPEDAGVGDAFGDADLPDAPAPDADPPDLGAPDLGLDAGFPDTGLNNDGGCSPPWALAAQPRSVATLTIGYDIDVPPLVADVDGDGHDELVVASTSQAEITVIDWVGCSATPQTASASQVPVGPGGILTLNGANGLQIVASSGTTVWMGRYQQTPPQLMPVGAPSTRTLSVDQIGSDLTGQFLYLLGETPGGNFGFVGYDQQGNPGMLEGTTEPIGWASFLSIPSGGGYPRFVKSDETMLRIQRPATSQWDLDDGSAVTPQTPPAVLRPGVFGAPDEAVVAYGADESGPIGGPQLSVFRVDVTDLRNVLRASTSVSATIVSGPITYSYGTGGSRGGGFIYGLADGTLAGCALASGLGWDCITSPFTPFNAGGGQVSENIQPLTTYIGNDNVPDVVYATPSGTIHFRDDGLRNAPFPAVVLGSPVLSTPAISETFFSRYNQDGSLMIVPISQGRVSIVIWQRPAQAGAPGHLWSQFRSDQFRSGHL